MRKPTVNIGDKYNSLRVISMLEGRDKHGRRQYRCQCDCGRYIITTSNCLRCENTKSCGKCHLPEIGHIYNRLTVLEVYPSPKGSGGRVKCRCECGNIWEGCLNQVSSGHTKSCGCYKSDMISERERENLQGKKFGRLTAIKPLGSNKHRKVVWECKCTCGQITHVPGCSLSNDATQSCGNCQNFANGKPVSIAQEQLHKMVGGKLNAKIGTFFVDILLDNGIVIEYDSWYYHGANLVKDTCRVNHLIDQGYKVLTIRSNKKIPKMCDLDSKLKSLEQADLKHEIIILEDWGKGQLFNESA